MQTHTSLLVICFLLISCGVDTELAQNSSQASKDFIAAYLKGDYKSIYENASIEMKAHVPEDIYLNVVNLQEKVHGKMVNAELQHESTGKYNISATNVYHYTLKNEAGEEYVLTAEFLRGHLLKSNIEPPDWSIESDFVKGLVAPVAEVLQQRNYSEIHQMMDEQFPLEQIESVMQKIAETCDGVAHRYDSSWTDNDSKGKMMVAFVYAYEGKGYLEYRFYIEDDNYPLAGIFFNPDEDVKLP